MAFLMSKRRKERQMVVICAMVEERSIYVSNTVCVSVLRRTRSNIKLKIKKKAMTEIENRVKDFVQLPFFFTNNSSI